MLAAANPGWKEFVDDLDARGEKLRTNPDGDVSPFWTNMRELISSIRLNCKDVGTMISSFPHVLYVFNKVKSIELYVLYLFRSYVLTCS